MEECRLCLKTCKRFKSLNDSKDGVTYWLMVQSISDIKISGGDTDEKACVSCCRRLIEAYNFKLLIESSDATLQNSEKTKRILFNNLEDIKIKIEIPDEKFINEEIEIKIDEDQFNYHNTLITRVAENEQKPLTVVQFLNSIKEQSEKDLDEGFAVHINDYNDDYQPNVEQDDYSYDVNYELSLSKRKTRNTVYDVIQPRVTRSNPGRILLNNEFRNKENRKKRYYLIKKFNKPIIPQVMDNVRLMKRPPKMKSEREKDICYQCGKLTLSMKSHLLTHSDEFKYKCDICSKCYRSTNALKQHQLKHKPRTLKCDHCVATFHTKFEIWKHMQYHSAAKNWVCELCSKAFKIKYHLKRHKQMAHNIGVKEHKCDVCDKVCKSTGLLKHHYRVHTRHRPFNCEICSQPYSYKHDFNRHCLKKHGVLFKRRSVYVMNEEVLVKEQALMRDLMLRINGVDKGDLPLNPFEGPQGALAYQQMMKFLESKQLPVDFQL